MEIDVECWLFFFYVHPYARMGTLRRSITKAKAEETDAARMCRFTNHGNLDVIRAEGTCHRSEENLVPRCNRSEKCLFEKPEHRGGVFRRWQKMCEPITDEKEKHSKKME